MKENRFYEVVNSHRKWWLLLFWAFGIFIGCFGFPFINITKALSDTQKGISLFNIFVVVVAYAEIGLLSGYLFEKKKIGFVILMDLAHIVLGMVARYFLEFGEVSNTYNFTLPNIALHVGAILCICFCGYLHGKKRIAER